MSKQSPPGLWLGQLLHFVALGIFLWLTWLFWVHIGSPFPFLFWLTITIPIIHQIFVWLTWRLELKASAISNSIGFTSYLIVFFILLVGRPVVFLILAWTDSESLGLSLPIRIIICSILFVPAMYTMYSVKKYFGFIRAAGGDHFDPKYRNMSIVKKGMFKYSSNSMYLFGFLIFWGIAIAFDSKATLLASAFCHAYIWVHHFATEKPDMNYLYGSQQ